MAALRLDKILLQSTVHGLQVGDTRLQPPYLGMRRFKLFSQLLDLVLEPDVFLIPDSALFLQFTVGSLELQGPSAQHLDLTYETTGFL